ncbi:MAG: SMC-Scp complex subunit ScpB [Candidatus Nanoarchaeia archaeon]|nr:SMC-Scp complex subunit ScpB [Candidatus Nanoarchaeia archaeon]
MEDHNKIEAVLFATGKFLSINEIASMCGIGSVGIIKEILENLKREYEEKNTSLELVNDNEKWKLTIKKEYLYLTEKLLSDCEFDFPTQETLAMVAYKNPVLQCDIIKIRGNKAYDHIKMLKDEGFLVSEKSGRTRLLKLTPKFFEYFNVIEGNIKLKDENT